MLVLTLSLKSSLDMQQICHRDLKLENTLLDGSAAPRLKICDFSYSKVVISSNLHYLSSSLVVSISLISEPYTSHQCYIRNPNQQWEHQHISPQRCCPEKNMMER